MIKQSPFGANGIAMELHSKGIDAFSVQIDIIDRSDLIIAKK